MPNTPTLIHYTAIEIQRSYRKYVYRGYAHEGIDRGECCVWYICARVNALQVCKLILDVKGKRVMWTTTVVDNTLRRSDYTSHKPNFVQWEGKNGKSVFTTKTQIKAKDNLKIMSRLWLIQVKIKPLQHEVSELSKFYFKRLGCLNSVFLYVARKRSL